MLYHYHQDLLGIYDSEYLDVAGFIEDLEEALEEQNVEMIEDVVIEMRRALRFVTQFCRILVQMVVVDIHSVRNLLNFYDFHYLKISAYVEDLEFGLEEQDEIFLQDIISELRIELHFVIAFCAKLEEQP
jgi:hypothetical protein